MVSEMPIGQLSPSIVNPRKHYDDHELADLAASIRELGVLQPLLVLDNGEIVCGHRRWKAAKKAGLKTVPVVVLDLDAVFDIRRAQVVENNQRADLDPIDEAEAFVKLLNEHESAASVGEGIGRSASYVAKRARLATLVDDCKDALRDGSISLSVAMLLARVPPESQPRALELVRRSEWQDALPASVAAKEIEREFMSRLDSFEFSRRAKNLGAPPCVSCGKVTGAQPVLFDDVEDPGLCTDVDCLARKRARNWELVSARHEKKGGVALSMEASKECFAWGSTLARGWVPIDASPPGHDQTWAKLLGDACPPITLARSFDGLKMKLWKLSDLKKAAKKIGLVLGPPKDPDRAEDDPRPTIRESKDDAGKLLEKVVAAFDQAVPGQAWNLVLTVAYEHAICGVAGFSRDPEIAGAFDAAIDRCKASDAEPPPLVFVHAALARILLWPLVEESYRELHPDLVELARIVGVKES